MKRDSDKSKKLLFHEIDKKLEVDVLERRE